MESLRRVIVAALAAFVVGNDALIRQDVDAAVFFQSQVRLSARDAERLHTQGNNISPDADVSLIETSSKPKPDDKHKPKESDLLPPEVEAMAMQIGLATQQSVFKEQVQAQVAKDAALFDGAKIPPSELSEIDRNYVGKVNYAGLSLLVLLTCGFCCCGGCCPGLISCFTSCGPKVDKKKGASSAFAHSVMQLKALSWKNAKVNYRTSLPCSICCPCCPSLCNGACALIAAPIIYIWLCTALPFTVIVKTANMKRYVAPLEYGPTENENHWVNWAKSPDVDLMGTLFTPDSILSPGGACYCHTLAIVGPRAGDFSQHLEHEYAAWKLAHPPKFHFITNMAENFTRANIPADKLPVRQCTAENRDPIFRVFSSPEEVSAWTQGFDYGTMLSDRSATSPTDPLCGAVIFENDPLSSPVPKLMLRTNVTMVDKLGMVSMKFPEQAPLGIQWTGLDWYMRSGFLGLQELVHRYVAMRLGSNHAPPKAVFGPMASNEYPMSDLFTTGVAVRGMLEQEQTCLTTFAPAVMLIAYYMVRERNSRQKEMMRLIGLYDSSLTFSWIIYFACANLAASLGCTYLIYTFVVQRSSALILLLIFWLGSMSMMMVGMVASTLVSGERLGAIVAYGASGILNLGYIGVVGNYGQRIPSTNGAEGPLFSPLASFSAQELFAVSLIPCVGFTLCMKTYFHLDNMHGCTWANLHHLCEGFYSVGGGLGMLIAAFFSWGLLYVYLDQVIEHDVGTAQPWYFIFKYSYWADTFGWDRVKAGGARGEIENQDSRYFEEENSAHQQTLREGNQVISIRGLRKEYTNGAGITVPAVNNLSLTMYEGECFCLLGHNGAGKSTTIGMMTGITLPSAGEIMVYGKQMPEEKLVVRQGMGFCMQHNVLWEELLVEEHLAFFSALAGFSVKDTQNFCRQALQKVELLHKRGETAGALSGGMKRKLNVAIALLGDRKVVILDEPTAGMDPHTRRQLWGLLKQNRADRIMCLTTHYMDEADELGDRVAIMSGGRAVCCGTNSFLKKQLGGGYMLTFVKKDESTVDEPIVEVVRQHCPSNMGEQATSVGRELRVQVLFAGAVGFPALMKELDGRLEELGLESYGVGVSDLEDVFLRADMIAEEAKAVAAATDKITVPAPAAAPPPPVSRSGFEEASFGRQFIGLTQRRFRYGRRDLRMCACQLGLPILIMLIFMCLSKRCIGATGFKEIPIGTSGWNSLKIEEHGPTSVSVGFAGDVPGEDDLRQHWINYLGSDFSQVHMVEYNSTKGVERAFADFMLSKGLDPKLDPQFGGILYSPNQVMLFPNTSASYTAPALFNAQFEQFMATQSALSSAPFDHFEMSSQPLDLTTFEAARDLKKFAMPMMISITVTIAFAYIGAGIAGFLTMEREMDVHHQLMTSGAGKVAYWLSNLVFDTIFGLSAFAGTMCILAIFGAGDFFSPDMYPATVLLLLLFAPAASAFGYGWSFCFESAGNALVGLLAGTLFISTIGLSVSQILIDMKPGPTRTIGHVLSFVTRIIFPTTCVGHGLMQIAINGLVAPMLNLSPFAGYLLGSQMCVPGLNELAPCLTVAGDDIILLIFDTLFYSAIALVGEYWMANPNLFAWTKQKEPKCPKKLIRPDDERVAAERVRVKGLDPRGQVLMMDNVSKVYNGRLHAVRGISWAAEGGQVFGLLGANGAGKTTTFKMLCGQILPSHGKVFLKGMNVQNNMQKVRSLIGYCPQFSSLLDLLTVREHLVLYGQIKGLSGAELAAEISEKTSTFDLTAFSETRAHQLSGGNARKLSTAIAVIREPPVVLLDEPSAGMDPKARRFMWDVIHRIAQKRKDSAVILTTHSMDEADALCSRIAIQCSGQVRCIGTPQQLKEWYGTGLELNVRLEDPANAKIEAVLKGWKIATSNVFAKQARDLVFSYASGRSFDESPLKSEDDTITLRALAEWCLIQEMALEVDAFLKEHLGEKAVSRAETSGGTLRYTLVGDCPSGGPLPYGELFSLLGTHGRELHFVDFQVSQGTLEKTFNHIANEDMARWEMESHAQKTFK